jgi:Putative restriction endonuclease
MGVTLEQYLHTSFEHDAEFVEGRIVERLGTYFEHGRMQVFLACELKPDHQLGWRTMMELRVRTAPNRIRVPDIGSYRKARPRIRRDHHQFSASI